MKTNKQVFASKISELKETDLTHPDNFFQSSEQNPLSDPYPIAPQAEHQQNAMQDVQTDVQEGPLDLRSEEQWFGDDEDSYDGQLAVDVYQDKKNIYIKAAIAGVNPKDIDIHMNNDMITIKGKRSQTHKEIDEEDYYIRECYWGGFSRSIILPVDIQTDKVEAKIENGLLTIILPKSKRPRNSKIEVQEVKSR